jgi:hypothetical protein
MVSRLVKYFYFPHNKKGGLSIRPTQLLDGIIYLNRRPHLLGIQNEAIDCRITIKFQSNKSMQEFYLHMFHMCETSGKIQT